MSTPTLTHNYVAGIAECGHKKVSLILWSGMGPHLCQVHMRPMQPNYFRLRSSYFRQSTRGVLLGRGLPIQTQGSVSESKLEFGKGIWQGQEGGGNHGSMTHLRDVGHGVNLACMKFVVRDLERGGGVCGEQRFSIFVDQFMPGKISS